MSLVEVIVSVAVSMIVLFIAATFMTTSMNFFSRQSDTIDLQDELLEASNQVNDALMSASALMIAIGVNPDGRKEGSALKTLCPIIPLLYIRSFEESLFSNGYFAILS